MNWQYQLQRKKERMKERKKDTQRHVYFCVTGCDRIFSVFPSCSALEPVDVTEGESNFLDVYVCAT